MQELELIQAAKVSSINKIVRCILQKGEKLYPQIYLDECLYELV